MRLPAPQTQGGGFHVLPDAQTNLTIQLESIASTAALAGSDSQITAVFSVSQIATCDSGPATEHASESHRSDEIAAQN